MRYTKQIVLILACFVSIGACSFSPVSKELPVVFKKQRMSNWCWSAVTSMAYEYATGEKTQDCQIATIYHEGGLNCCPFNLKCNHGLRLSHIKYLLEVQLGLEVEFRQGQMSFEEIVNSIDRNETIIAGVMRDNFDKARHATLITGYFKTSEHLYILDPNLGRMSSSYKVFAEKHEQLGEWVWSLIVKPKKN